MPGGEAHARLDQTTVAEIASARAHIEFVASAILAGGADMNSSGDGGSCTRQRNSAFGGMECDHPSCDLGATVESGARMHPHPEASEVTARFRGVHVARDTTTSKSGIRASGNDVGAKEHGSNSSVSRQDAPLGVNGRRFHRREGPGFLPIDYSPCATRRDTRTHTTQPKHHQQRPCGSGKISCGGASNFHHLSTNHIGSGCGSRGLACSTTTCTQTSVAAISIADVLKLEHGSRSDADGKTVSACGSAVEGAYSSAVAGGEREGLDETGGGEVQKVLAGVLAFESLREGTLALSSLFLRDETGSIRLICVPQPPASWVGMVVCLSQWTWTVEKKPHKGARFSKTPPHNCLPTPFSACLEVNEMTLWQNAPTLISARSEQFAPLAVPPQPNPLNTRRTSTNGDICVMEAAPKIATAITHHTVATCEGRDHRRSSGVEVEGGVIAQPGKRGEENVRNGINLSEAYAGGAVGLEAFVGRKGRGPVDVVARVAAMSPVIRFKDASPFFMLEVEQVEEQDEHTANSFSRTSGDSSQERSTSSVGRFGDATGPRSSDNDGGRRPTTGAASDSTSGGSSIDTAALGRGDSRKQEVPGDEGRGGSTLEQYQHEQQPAQLMAMLVLNGRRCLPWHACIVPGRTYVFPGMGAIVLGGRSAGQTMYRAFGDALGGRRGESTLKHSHLVQVDTDGASQQHVETPKSTVLHCPTGLQSSAGNSSGRPEGGESPASPGGGEERTVHGKTGSGLGLGCHGGDGRGSGERCECVMTYEGEITGLAAQAGTYSLDGNDGEKGINLYFQHFHCSSLGAGLRRGAIVRIHNVHPVYFLGKLQGLGACLRSTIQILRFSPHGASAAYRPITGGPNPYPLAVHAWKHAFHTLFLRKEIPPSMATPTSKDIGGAESCASPNFSRDPAQASFSPSYEDRSGSSSWQERSPQHPVSSKDRDSSCINDTLPEDTPASASERPLKGVRTIKGFVSAARLVDQYRNESASSHASFVSHSAKEVEGIRGAEARKDDVAPKRSGKIVPGMSFSKWAGRVAKWVFGDAMVLPKRDVYAEFLRHPPGVCNIVDLRTSGCRFCTWSVPGNVSGGENSDLENDPESYAVDRATGLENCEDHCDAGDATLDEKFQRADEAWHGDSLPRYPHYTPAFGASPSEDGLHQRHHHRHQHQQHQSSNPAVKKANADNPNNPTPNSILRAASRPLSELLDVAAQHAVDHASSILLHPQPRGCGTVAADAAAQVEYDQVGKRVRLSTAWGSGGGGGGSSWRPSGAHGMFAVRTPFGQSSGRDDGALGWLSLHDTLSRDGATRSGGSTAGVVDGNQHRDSGNRYSAGARARVGAGNDGRGGASEGRRCCERVRTTAGGNGPVVWLRDRTARALVVVTTSTTTATMTAAVEDRACPRRSSCSPCSATTACSPCLLNSELTADGARVGGCAGGSAGAVDVTTSGAGGRVHGDPRWVGSVDVVDAPRFASGTTVGCHASDKSTAGRGAAWLSDGLISDDQAYGKDGGRASGATSSMGGGKRRQRPWEQPRGAATTAMASDIQFQHVRDGSNPSWSILDPTRFPAPQAPCPRPRDAGMRVRGGERSSGDGGGLSAQGTTAQAGEVDGAACPAAWTTAASEPTLGLLRKFAICTEVVLLGVGNAGVSTAARLPESSGKTAAMSSAKAAPESSRSERYGGAAAKSERRFHPGDRNELFPGFAEVRVLAGGASILLRHYIVVDESDMQLLSPHDGITGNSSRMRHMGDRRPITRSPTVGDSSLTGDSDASSCSFGEPLSQKSTFSSPFHAPVGRVAATRSPSPVVLDLSFGNSSQGSSPHGADLPCSGDSVGDSAGERSSGDLSVGGAQQPAVAGCGTPSSTVKRSQQQHHRQPRQQQQQHQEQQQHRRIQEDRPYSPEVLTVSEALVVKLAPQHHPLKSNPNGMHDSSNRVVSGPKIDPNHEREFISVVGVLIEVGFRVGGSGRAAKAPIVSKRGLDMFQKVSERGLQLCLTLAQGVDRVSVYAGICAESWPPGMIPGYAVVQVSGVSRRLSSNGKNMYLVKGQGGVVKVLSLGLPPPPPHLPAVGWPMKPAKQATLSSVERTATATTPSGRDGSSTPYPGAGGGSSSPILLFRGPSTVPAADHTADRTADNAATTAGTCSNQNGVGGDDQARGKAVRGSFIRERPCCRSSQCSEYSCAGSAISTGSPGPSLHSSERCAAGCAARAVAVPVQFPGRGVVLGNRGGRTVFVDTHPIDERFSADVVDVAGEWRSMAAAAGRRVLPSSSVATGTAELSPAVGASDESFSVLSAPTATPSSSPSCGVSLADSTPAAPSLAPPLAGVATLASLYKRGVLVRTTRRFGSLTVVGVRFVKASTWCINCGVIKVKDLEIGRCWARCHTPSTWEVRWEGSANVDDGTAQAQILMDGDDVLRLLKLSPANRKQVESAALHYGPVVLSERAPRHVVLASRPPPQLLSARDVLEAAVKRVTSTRGTKIAANCVQVALKKRGASDNTTSARGGEQGYGSAVVDVMGDGMETLTLPKLVLQASRVEDSSVRSEAYACLGRLKALD